MQTATSARDGLEKIAEDDIDCIVSDYDMHSQNGIEFLETIREEYSDIPFILFTGKGSEEVASEAMSAGATDYIQKGTDIEQYEVLAKRISNYVEQHRAKRELEETSRWYSQLLAYSADFVMVVDESGEIDYISPAVERVMGYTPDELVSQSTFDLVNPEDTNRVKDAFSATIGSPETEVVVEFRAKHVDESDRWLEMRGRNLLQNPIVDGILLNVRDITERVHREQELRHERTFMEECLDAIHNGFLILNGDGDIVRWNQPVQEITGYSDQDLDGLDVTSLFVREDVERIEDAIGAVIDSGSVRIETTIETSAGERVPFEFYGRKLSNPLDDELLIAGGLRDISGQQARDSEIVRYRERFETLASMLSHDLRNRLNVANGRLELAREEHDNEHLSELSGSLHKMEQLIKAFRTLTRQWPPIEESEPIRVGRLVTEAWSNLDAPDATLMIDIDQTIIAEETRLTELLEQLFRNAIHYGGEGVTVTIGELEDGFFVEDDGPGLSEEQQDVIEIGYSTSRTGDGLGLSIARAVAEAHGWSIDVTEGRAGGFRVELTDIEVTD